MQLNQLCVHNSNQFQIVKDIMEKVHLEIGFEGAEKERGEGGAFHICWRGSFRHMTRESQYRNCKFKCRGCVSFLTFVQHLIVDVLRIINAIFSN